MKFIHVIEKDNFTDLYKQLQSDLVNEGVTIEPRDMLTRELLNVNLILTNPQERLLYSKVRKHNYTYASAEFLWYLSGTNRLDFIEYYLPRMREYSDDNVTLNSAYGYRIFGKHNDFPNQWINVLLKLKDDPDTRQGVITIHYQYDIDMPSKDVPCTMNLHFMIRDNRLNLLVQMRSNDAFMGLIYDVFSFTLLQEHFLNCLKIVESDMFKSLKLGTYVHKADSMHIYERNLNRVGDLLEEDSISARNILSPDIGLFLDSLDLTALQRDEQKLRIHGIKIETHLYRGMCKFMAEKLNKILEKENA